MIPKKPNKLFKEIAEEQNIGEDLVDKFITFYYKEVRRHLSELNYTRINLDGLGQMVIKPKTVDKLILKYSSMANKADTFEFSGYFNKKRLEARLESLSSVKQKIDVSQSQPPELKGQGNAERGEGTLDVNSLSEDEFNALPEETLRRLRGDFG